MQTRFADNKKPTTSLLSALVFNIQNNRHSVENILRWLRLQHCGPEDVHVVMEATGVYHERLATVL